jgi:hypothetical protein
LGSASLGTGMDMERRVGVIPGGNPLAGLGVRLGLFKCAAYLPPRGHAQDARAGSPRQGRNRMSGAGMPSHGIPVRSLGDVTAREPRPEEGVMRLGRSPASTAREG